MKPVQIIRIIRTTADLPESVPPPSHRTTELYDPWFCVACGHPHHGMTRHHRVPKRVSWKIPASIQREILAGDQRIVPLCQPCHCFIETGKRGPCPLALNLEYALLSYARLMEEIRIFDRIAYERTEELIRKMKSRAGQ